MRIFLTIVACMIFACGLANRITCHPAMSFRDGAFFIGQIATAMTFLLWSSLGLLLLGYGAGCLIKHFNP